VVELLLEVRVGCNQTFCYLRNSKANRPVATRPDSTTSAKSNAISEPSFNLSSGRCNKFARPTFQVQRKKSLRKRCHDAPPSVSFKFLFVFMVTALTSPTRDRNQAVISDITKLRPLYALCQWQSNLPRTNPGRWNPQRPILGITGRTLGSSEGKTFRTKTVRRVVRRISNQACQWAYRLASGKHILGQKMIVDA
jgi:hypothetical protein